MSGPRCLWLRHRRTSFLQLPVIVRGGFSLCLEGFLLALHRVFLGLLLCLEGVPLRLLLSLERLTVSFLAGFEGIPLGLLLRLERIALALHGLLRGQNAEGNKTCKECGTHC